MSLLHFIINRKHQPQVRKEVPSDLGQHPFGLHLPGQLSFLHGGVRRRRDHQDWRERHASRKNSLPSAARSFPSLPGPLRLVDAQVWRLDSVLVRHARKRNGCVCANIFEEQNGCAQIFGLQLGGGRLLHGNLFR